MGKTAGKWFREGLGFLEIADMFGDEDKAREWIAAQRWPQGPHCPKCGSTDVQCGIKHKTMTHRCRDCYNDSGKSRTMFSIKTGTVMKGSNLKYRAWAIGIYMFMSNIKGIPSTRLRRELGISQKAAWFMLHRLRAAFDASEGPFSGPVEVDETYFGGKRKNMSRRRRREIKESGTAGRGTVGKTAVVGMKDRETGKVVARVVKHTTATTLQGFVEKHTEPKAKVYTDEAKAYKGVKRPHEAVNHSVGEYVRDMAHTNGIESHWALMKRGLEGIYLKMSPKHLNRYVQEFAGRHNIRDSDTIDQMKAAVAGMVGKRLRYRELVAGNGLPSGTRGKKA